MSNTSTAQRGGSTLGVRVVGQRQQHAADLRRPRAHGPRYLDIHSLVPDRGYPQRASERVSQPGTVGSRRHSDLGRLVITLVDRSSRIALDCFTADPGGQR